MKFELCFITGERPFRLPFGNYENHPDGLKFKKYLYDVIETQIVKNGVINFITGIKTGTETYAAEIVLALKKIYPQITLELAITEDAPFRDSERYKTLLKNCDKKTMLENARTAYDMQGRDYYLVDRADILIAVWNGASNEIGRAALYADEKEKAAKRRLFLAFSVPAEFAVSQRQRSSPPYPREKKNKRGKA